jgi:hypothetical protein
VAQNSCGKLQQIGEEQVDATLDKIPPKCQVITLLIKEFSFLLPRGLTSPSPLILVIIVNPFAVAWSSPWEENSCMKDLALKRKKRNSYIPTCAPSLEMLWSSLSATSK